MTFINHLIVCNRISIRCWSQPGIGTPGRWVMTSDGSGSKIFDPGRIGSIFCGSGQVSHSWFGLEFGKFCLKTSNFGSKKIASGQVGKFPGQSRVGLLFTAGQK